MMKALQNAKRLAKDLQNKVNQRRIPCCMLQHGILKALTSSLVTLVNEATEFCEASDECTGIVDQLTVVVFELVFRHIPY